jgi:hypothetical protein
MRVKHYAFAAASVVLLVLVLASPSLAAPGNAKPCLCNPTITPMKGTARTVYVATVKYNDPDGDVPARVEVNVDNVAYPMRLAGGRPANGTYRARLTLPPGEHSYFFYAEDVRGASERFPRYGARTGPFVGATKPMNLLPIMTEGGVYFDYGSDRSIYTYTVHYKDRDGCKPPRCIKVFVDGIGHEMAFHSGTRINGIYHYQTMLPEGPHAYYFMAMDGDGDCVSLPAQGFIRGPEVMAQPNSAPVLIDNRIEPATGGTTNRYGYLVHYNDVDGDNPPTALIYVDNVPHAMKMVKGNDANGLYSYVGRLFLGNFHKYYFYFEDGKGGTCRLPAVGIFHGPVVTR